MPDGQKEKFISEDMKKTNSFYTFNIDQEKFVQIKKNSRRQIARFAITGLIFGFFTQWLLGNGTIYSNIVKKSTMRRLSKFLDQIDAKRKQEIKFEERALKRGEEIRLE